MLRDDEKKAAKIDITNLQTCLLQKKKKHREIEIQHLSTWVATCLKMLYLDLSVLFFLSAAHSKHLPDGSKSFRPRRDSNSQSSDPKSDALSIRPRGHGNTNP